MNKKIKKHNELTYIIHKPQGLENIVEIKSNIKFYKINMIGSAIFGTFMTLPTILDHTLLQQTVEKNYPEIFFVEIATLANAMYFFYRSNRNLKSIKKQNKYLDEIRTTNWD